MDTPAGDQNRGVYGTFRTVAVDKARHPSSKVTFSKTSLRVTFQGRHFCRGTGRSLSASWRTRVNQHEMQGAACRELGSAVPRQ
jgi:hypothetical protein